MRWRAIAGLVGVSVIGVVVASSLAADNFGPNAGSASTPSTRRLVICAALVATGGVIAAVGIVNPRQPVPARRCAGGQLVAAPEPAAQRAHVPAGAELEGARG